MGPTSYTTAHLQSLLSSSLQNSKPSSLLSSTDADTKSMGFSVFTLSPHFLPLHLTTFDSLIFLVILVAFNIFK